MAGLGRDPERLRASASGSRTARRSTRSSSSPAARPSRSSASSSPSRVGGETTVLMDGVMTHTRSPPTAARRRRCSSGQGHVGPDGHPARSTGSRTRRCRRRCASSPRSRSTPAFGVVPMVIPSVLEDVPIPIERIPRHQGTDYSYIRALAHEVGYVFYLDPGPGARREPAYWGPEIRLGAPQKPLDVALDGPHAIVKNLRFRFDKEKKELPVVFIQEPASKAPIPIPIPDVTPLNPPLGLVPPLPPRITLPEGHGEAEPARRGDARARLRGPAQRLGVRHGDARRRALRPRAQVAAARRRPGRRRGVRRPPLRHVGHLDADARRVHAVRSRSRATRSSRRVPTVPA